jgi:hypothetical protein
MRSTILLFLPLIALLALPATAQGQLTAVDASYDFGEIAADTEVSTTFVLRNDGDAPVRLTEARPSCGCTVPQFTTDAVAPGGLAEVTVAYDATSRSGPFRHSVIMLGDGGGDEPLAVTLNITGRVVPAALLGAVPQGGVRFNADVHDFGDVPAGEPLRHQYLMQRTGAQPIVITRAHAFPAGAHIAYPERPIFRDDVVRIEVHLPAEAVQGDFDVALALETDDPQEPIKLLRLTGRAR